ncbi:MAG: hypothetical protein QNK37_06425 [Acidobacteriota bacterium]|nr:hypothetical protein [Acidobacteriota bacterium]
MKWFRKFSRRTQAPPEPELKPNQMTEALIVSMIADGADYDQLKAFFNDMPEEALKRIVKKACDGLGLFPEDPADS